MKKITIAIDGYSSCGKSTMAKDLAREIGYIYIDSGAMYRAVTLYCLDNGLFTDSGIREGGEPKQPARHQDFFPAEPGNPASCHLAERRRGGRTHPDHGSFFTRKPGCRPRICSGGIGETATGNGQAERNCDGRTRYRNRGFS